MNLTNEFDIFEKKKNQISGMNSHMKNHKIKETKSDEQRINALLQKITSQIESS